MMQLETFSEAQIVSMLNAHYQKGVRVRHTALCSAPTCSHELLTRAARHPSSCTCHSPPPS